MKTAPLFRSQATVAPAHNKTMWFQPWQNSARIGLCETKFVNPELIPRPVSGGQHRWDGKHWVFVKGLSKRHDMRTVLTALLMLASAPAWAEWEKFYETDAAVFYLDPATIRKDGDLRRVWELVDKKTRSPEGDLSQRLLEEYDCREERFRLLSFSAYGEPMGIGKNLMPSSNPGKWSAWVYAVPGTFGEGKLKFVCAR